MLKTTTVCLFLVILATGCRSGGPNTPADKAETALQKVLDAWTRGESADKYADAKEPIQLTDPDWKAGHRLLSFLIVEATPSADNPSRIRCKVALSKSEPGGQPVDKDVFYMVQMGSKIVIERQP